MSRPLLVTDCDEVLLHMVSHFGAWLGEAHGVDFALNSADFGNALTRAGAPLAREEVWPLLDGFFATEMHRQTLVPHAREGLERIGHQADIVILTNIVDAWHPGRVAQLDAHGIRHRVVCNQGGKGRAVAALLDEFGPSVAAFVDDLPQHHESVARHCPTVWRLHMIAEPRLAPLIPAAPEAHVRLDDWADAAAWIGARFAGGVGAAQAGGA